MVSLLVRNNPDVWAKTSGLLHKKTVFENFRAIIPEIRRKTRGLLQMPLAFD